jgi:ribosome-binding factor A
MADPARAAKLAQRIKVVVAEALGRRVKDPRVESITITDAASPTTFSTPPSTTPSSVTR